MMAPLRDGVSNAAVVSAKLKLFVFGGTNIHRDKASKVGPPRPACPPQPEPDLMTSGPGPELRPRVQPLGLCSRMPSAVALHRRRRLGQPDLHHGRRHGVHRRVCVPLRLRHQPVDSGGRHDVQEDELPRRCLGQQALRGGRLLWDAALQNAGLLRPHFGQLELHHHGPLLLNPHCLRQHVEARPCLMGAPPDHANQVEAKTFFA